MLSGIAGQLVLYKEKLLRRAQQEYEVVPRALGRHSAHSSSSFGSWSDAEAEDLEADEEEQGSLMEATEGSGRRVGVGPAVLPASAGSVLDLLQARQLELATRRGGDMRYASKQSSIVAMLHVLFAGSEQQLKQQALQQLAGESS